MQGIHGLRSLQNRSYGQVVRCANACGEFMQRCAPSQGNLSTDRVREIDRGGRTCVGTRCCTVWYGYAMYWSRGKRSQAPAACKSSCVFLERSDSFAGAVKQRNEAFRCSLSILLIINLGISSRVADWGNGQRGATEDCDSESRVIHSP